MKQAAVKPRFIVLDGLDGTGKTTQCTLLAEYLIKSGVKAAVGFEPGGTEAGRRIREILLNSQTSISKETELLLFSADRAEHQVKVASLLELGFWVISDRFLSSTWAYQVRGRSAPIGLFEAVLPYTIKQYPDLTIILDLEAESAVQRSLLRLKAEGKEIAEGRFESEKSSFFQKTREGFLEYAANRQYGETIIINAAQTIEEVSEQIIDAVRERFL
ncbi:MAG: dTMP kinase [Deferribacteraceae bacterium]|jgi:dTMP kinase|nr:dTMP kinase [Deferribacteraceae bacterium]